MIKILYRNHLAGSSRLFNFYVISQQSLNMRMNGELTPDEYVAKKVQLNKEKQHTEELIQDMQHRFDTWLQKAEDLLSFAETAKQQFETGDLKTKRQIIQTLGSNL